MNEKRKAEIRRRVKARRSYVDLGHLQEGGVCVYIDREALLAEVERLEKERDEFRKSRGLAIVKCDGLAEEVERLRTALEWIVAAADCYNGPVVKIARDTLKGKDRAK